MEITLSALPSHPTEEDLIQQSGQPESLTSVRPACALPCMLTIGKNDSQSLQQERIMLQTVPQPLQSPLHRV